MGKATIIEDKGSGLYSIQRVWSGRDLIQVKIDAYDAEVATLEAKLLLMPQTTDAELFERHIVQLQIASFQKKSAYLTNNMPEDKTVDAWCSDYTEELTGTVGTIDIAGEFTSDVNIRPGYVDDDELAQDIIDIEAEIITAKNDLAAIPAETAEMTAIKFEIAWRTAAWKLMPETTPEEIEAKTAALKTITDLQKQYSKLNLAQERLIATATRKVEGLEATLVCLKSGSHYCLATAGELYPGIALGPWTSLLYQMIYPGWQKFKPLHRYAWIVDGTIDLEANTCAVAIQPTFSLMNYNVNMSATGTGDREPAAGEKIHYSRVKNYNVNYGDTLGQEQIELIKDGIEVKGYARDFFIQRESMVHPGFLDFVDRNPEHPISIAAYPSNPIYITDEQYVQLTRICAAVNLFQYKSDYSGYKVNDHWDVMSDIGDPWYWVSSYPDIGSANWNDYPEEWKAANPREPQDEFSIGYKALTYDDSGQVIGWSLPSRFDDVEYYVNHKIGYSYIRGGFITGKYTLKNLRLEFQAKKQNVIKMTQARTGDCEDFCLTKMQAIIEANIIPAESMQVVLCYVRNAGYHAVLGIQTVNKGFLISDQIEPSQLWEIQQLSNTHVWSNFSLAKSSPGASAIKWSEPQVILKDVPIEYMACNAAAFMDGDEVVVEFTDQDWDKPKVIGFRTDPVDCSVDGFFTFGVLPLSSSREFAMKYTVASDSWSEAGMTLPTFDMVRFRVKATKEDIFYLVTGGATRGDDYYELEPWPDMCVRRTGGDICTTFPNTNSWLIWHGRRGAHILNGMLSTWVNVTDYPSPKRATHSGWFLNGKHYMCGGTNYPNGYQYFETGSIFSLRTHRQDKDIHSDLDEYDKTSDVWKGKTPMPRALDKMADFAIGTLGFVAGGNTDYRSFYGVKYVSRYSSIEDSWSAMQQLPKWRYDCAGFEANGKGYVVRGQESTGIIVDGIEQIDIYPSDKPLEYDKNADTWTYVQNHPIRANHQHDRGHGAAGYDSKGYSVSQNDAGFSMTNEEYDPLTDTWTLKALRPGGWVSQIAAA